MSHIHSPSPLTLPHLQMPAQSVSATTAPRQKSKAYATGIAAGVEDEKYQTKYKELKRKVKEIETVSKHHNTRCILNSPAFRTMTSFSTRFLWLKNLSNV